MIVCGVRGDRLEAVPCLGQAFDDRQFFDRRRIAQVRFGRFDKAHGRGDDGVDIALRCGGRRSQGGIAQQGGFERIVGDRFFNNCRRGFNSRRCRAGDLNFRTDRDDLTCGRSGRRHLQAMGLGQGIVRIEHGAGRCLFRLGDFGSFDGDRLTGQKAVGGVVGEDGGFKRLDFSRMRRCGWRGGNGLDNDRRLGNGAGGQGFRVEFQAATGVFGRNAQRRVDSARLGQIDRRARFFRCNAAGDGGDQGYDRADQSGQQQDETDDEDARPCPVTAGPIKPVGNELALIGRVTQIERRAAHGDRHDCQRDEHRDLARRRRR